MKQILNTNYWNVYLHTDLNILHIIWKITAPNMNEDDFKAHILSFAEKVEHSQPNGFLVDCLNGHFVVSPEIQEWHDAVIVPIYLRAGLQKIAFVLPEDLFAATSIEQSFAEQKGQLLNTHYFPSVEKALDWIKP